MTASSDGKYDLQYDDSETMQLIAQAILFENEELLTDLTQENLSSLYKVDAYERTPYMLAAHSGKAKSLRALMRVAPDLNVVTNASGKTALHFAAESGSIECVKILVEFGLDPSQRDNTGHCALEAAHIAGHDDVAAVLIEAIQNESKKLDNLHSRLIAACINGSCDLVNQILGETSLKTIDVILNGRSPDEDSALYIACLNGQHEVVVQLLSFSQDDHRLINTETKDTVFHAAVSSQTASVLQQLLACFPTLVSNANLEGSTCLHWASQSGCLPVVKCLLEYEYPAVCVKEFDKVSSPSYTLAIDVNQGDNQCRTPLYLAVSNERFDVVKYMVEFRCGFVDGSRRCPFHLDVYCNRGRTPLMVAAFNQSLPILILLVENGADVNLPLAILDIDLKDDEAKCTGSGSLVEAARADSVLVVNFLLDHGAVDTDNRALSLCSSNKNEKLMRTFLTRLVYPDPEYKINRKNVDVGQVGQNLLPSALCPSRSAMLNWGSCNLSFVNVDWFISAAVQVNPRLRTTRLALAAITRVDLSENCLTTFPSVLFQMPSLRFLNLSKNCMKCIEMPHYSVSSSSLETLNLSSNLLHSISTELLSGLPHLTHLDVSNNNISSLPEYIWMCPTLKELNVSNNSLSSLPMVAASRNRTPKLHSGVIYPVDAGVPDSDESDLPNVSSVPLTRLNVWQHTLNLSKVGDDELFPDFPVTSSNTLITLNLAGNKFKVFPAGLSCTCPRLSTLNLSVNLLSILPSVSCLPAHLRNLDLSDNLITECFELSPSQFFSTCHAVPPSSSTGRLARRAISPQRNSRSRSKSAVRSQRSLSVSRHQAIDGQTEEGCVHKRHDTLEWMKTLNLSGNKLKSFRILNGDKVIMPALTVLDLSRNLLKSVPAEVSRLSNLSVFNLSQNKQLREIAPQVGMLSRLWSLSLKGCPLKEPLETMVNVDNCKTVEIVAFLKTILEESKTYHHLRLMIVGTRSVGKSVIWDALRSEAVQKKQIVQCESVRVVDWKYEVKKPKGEASRGSVGFTAWDFSGQRGYQAIHPYFYTRRSVYIIVWRVTDGELALDDVNNLLVSIQARAPNCCCILVGTHVDQIFSNSTRFPEGYLTDLEAKVHTRFMRNDSDKRGIPKITDLLFVSAKNKSDMKTLLAAICKTAWEVKIGKERALDQKIPSSYIALMKIVREMAQEFRKEEACAVLSLERFKERAIKRMSTKFDRPFRDDIELRAAMSFLHDSGELVHFEDASLRQLVFVDPVWLSDFLASCVSARTSSLPPGLVNQDDMLRMVKNMPILSNSLLDIFYKFELAMVCHPRQLLVPSLLPDEYQLRADYPAAGIKVSAKVSEWMIRRSSVVNHKLLERSASVSQRKDVDQEITKNGSNTSCHFVDIEGRQFRRLYAMAYVPAGFWSRLVTRIIGDQNVLRAIGLVFCTIGGEADDTHRVFLNNLKPEWLLWKTGIEVLINGHSLFVMKQFFPQAEVRDIDYSTILIQSRDEQKRWRSFDVSGWGLIEMLFPSLRVTAVSSNHKVVMETDTEGVSRLMALVVDLVDTLLEDWYPSLGTRFVHTSEGDLLVNRFVPCFHCAQQSAAILHRDTGPDNVIHNTSKRNESALRGSKTMGDICSIPVLNCFTIEECILAGKQYGWLECPTHGGVHVKHISPDTLFLDLESSSVIPPENIKRGRLLGRGAFGFVFRASVKVSAGDVRDVAQKMLEPVDPGSAGRASALAAYKAAADKWRRDSSEFACRAYCTSRQELNLLTRLRHPHVVGLIGVSVSPLSLIVELAPLGALNQLLSSHRKSGARLPITVIRDSAIQIAKALEYLHSAFIIYRDLKSENVLVWRFPIPFSSLTEVLLKLGDYGISRSVLPSGGVKGFGGTEGFMAPEIIRFNGEEEYTNKVDVFSFGMYLYELVTLRLPFEGEDHVKERILEGVRPVLLPHELLVPCSMLDLLVESWRSLPDARPSSSQLVGFCAAPEFSHVLDVCLLSEALPPSHCLSVPMGDYTDDPDEFEAQLWLAGKDLTVISCTQYAWLEQKLLSLENRAVFLCRIRDVVWVCDDMGLVTAFSSSYQEMAQLQLPSLTSPLIRAPELLPDDVLLMVSENDLKLLHLSLSNAVSVRGSLTSPHPITTALFLATSNSRQIWTGHSEGRIAIHHLSHDDSFSFSSSLYLPDDCAVVQAMICNRDGSHVWITCKNSSKIYCLNVENRQVHCSLDVKKVMPASETIHTMDMEMAANNFVTSFCLLEQTEGLQLYVGTSKGLLIVVNALQLLPISACRPFDSSLCSVCVLENNKEDEGFTKVRSSTSNTSSESGLSWVKERVSETMDRFRTSPAQFSPSSHCLIATVGRGFRSLSHRFVSEMPLSDMYSVALWRTDDWI